MTSTVLVITGPTAVGKTDVALAIAERYPVALISMDSAMVYRGMDLGTAKPSAEVRARHPHALVDIRDPAQAYSAAEFVADADRAVAAALTTGKVPLLVGGSMLYLKAFREGLAELPPADPEVRAAIAAEADRVGWPALHDALAAVDPNAARGLHPNNQVRVQRALEVYRLTGRPISEWWSEGAGRSAERRLGVRLAEVAVVPEARGDLADRITHRFQGMLRSGLLDEVARLKARHDLTLEAPSMRSVGYRQVWEYLEGEGDLDDLAARGAAATRSLAKRQLTWLKRWSHVTRYRTGGRVDALARAIAAHARLEIS